MGTVNVPGLGDVPSPGSIYDSSQEVTDLVCKQNPGPRAHHVGVYFDQKVYVLGGLTNASTLKAAQDMWYRDDRLPRAALSVQPEKLDFQKNFMALFDYPDHKFRARWDEEGTIFEYMLYDADENVVVRTWDKTRGKAQVNWLDKYYEEGPGSGTYIFYIRALDPAGNVDISHPRRSGNLARWRCAFLGEGRSDPSSEYPRGVPAASPRPVLGISTRRPRGVAATRPRKSTTKPVCIDFCGVRLRASPFSKRWRSEPERTSSLRRYSGSRNLWKWKYNTRLPWDFIGISVLSFCVVVYGAWWEYKRRKKRAAMERHRRPSGHLARWSWPCIVLQEDVMRIPTPQESAGTVLARPKTERRAQVRHQEDEKKVQGRAERPVQGRRRLAQDDGRRQEETKEEGQETRSRGRAERKKIFFPPGGAAASRGRGRGVAAASRGCCRGVAAASRERDRGVAASRGRGRGAGPTTERPFSRRRQRKQEKEGQGQGEAEDEEAETKGEGEAQEEAGVKVVFVEIITPSRPGISPPGRPCGA